MEVGGTSTSSTPTRKRKAAALEGHRAPAPAAATGTADPGIGEDGGGGSGENERHLSSLPNVILEKIISHLPMKAGGRTQILAKWCSNLWSSAPLNLDCSQFIHLDPATGKLKLTDVVVSKIFSSHKGHFRRFCTPSYWANYDDATLQDWLVSPCLDKLQELEFYSRWQNWKPVPAPASVFRSSPTLCVAIFGHCSFTDDTVQGLHFPHLKKLVLDYVFVSECSLNSMIAGCPSLECLVLCKCCGASCIRINSIALRSIAVAFTLPSIPIGNYLPMDELVIENAPCLERLFHIDQGKGLHLKVLSAPKLKTLGCTTSTSIVFGSKDIHQGPSIGSLATPACTIKSLAMPTLSLDIVIELMRCFPCLEKLYIQCYSSGKKNLWRRKYRKLLQCIDIRLKTIALDSYRGVKSDTDFATFFLLNARALKSMTLVVKTDNQEFLAKQRKKLQLQNMASSGSQLHFTTEHGRQFEDIKYFCDLDSVDPFKLFY